MKRSTRERIERALGELNRAWDELSDDDYDAAGKLEDKVLEPLYDFAQEHGISDPERK
jgi:hypothetical protein